MAVTILKPTRIVDVGLQLLLRSIVLPGLVWRDAVGDFAGVANDTISIRLPAYAPARNRTLRSGAARTKDSLFERKVDVTLDTDVYKDIPISDEELTLDIADFGAQILQPVMVGIALQLEQELADTITGASYDRVISYDLDTGDPYKDIAVESRRLLNLGNVPMQGRALLVGSTLEAAFLDSPQFARANYSGSTQTLREAQIGRVAGYDVYTSNAIPPDEAYAFHKTAYIMSTRAPIVPAGAPWGASQSLQGFAVRTVRVFDPNEIEDRFIADAWVGSNVVTDRGEFDEVTDQFIPSEDPAESGASDMIVRAVQITSTS